MKTAADYLWNACLSCAEKERLGKCTAEAHDAIHQLQRRGAPVAKINRYLAEARHIVKTETCIAPYFSREDA